MKTISDVRRELKLGDDCFNKLVEYKDLFSTVFDVGGGDGYHALKFAGIGKFVTLVDICVPDIHHELVTLVQCPFEKAYTKTNDLVWCCHVLEHQVNPGVFLNSIKESVKEGGIIAITVPPLKHQIVGGHVSLWNAGLLLYRLVLSGLDCSEAKVLESGYNISVILKKKSIDVPSGLKWDYGDITTLREFFPIGLEWGNDSFNGDIKELNW